MAKVFFKDCKIIDSNLNNVKKIVLWLTNELQNLKLDKETIVDIQLALLESITNAIIHGNKDNSKKVQIRFSLNDNEIKIIVKDEGLGFDYNNIPDPTKDDKLLCNNGRGIFLIKCVMDHVRWNKLGNQITMIKKINKKRLDTT